ncbi:MAG: hypothetical protein AB8F94_29045 [Saprospiraceae bacterium]
MKKFKLNTDKIIGLSAMLISLLTLVIFIYQTNLIREQSRLSVTPRLAFNYSLDTPDTFSIFSYYIVNKGLGPAIIESIEIINENDRYKLDFQDFVKNVYPKFNDYGIIIQNMSLDSGVTISEKETIKFFTFRFKATERESFFKYLKVKDSGELPFDIEVVYSSIYGEKWRVYANTKGHPIKLGS